ncbi:MAG: sigma-70 family RNA polymerase sigma factor [Microthrixaceae bacterium]
MSPGVPEDESLAEDIAFSDGATLDSIPQVVVPSAQRDADTFDGAILDGVPRWRGDEDPTGDPTLQLEELFRERFDPMVRLATLMSGSQDVAQEIVMDAFSKLAPRLDSVLQPAAYLRTSVINGVRSHHRRLRTVRKQPIPVPAAVWDPDVDEMWNRLELLRPDERACVVLRFYGDMSISDIAAQLDLPAGTVKSHLHRSIAKLRDLLTEELS